jgi:WD40 repeat protein
VFSPDGKTIACPNDNRTISLWDVAGGNLKQTLIGHKDGVNEVNFSSDSKTLVSASDDKTLKLWLVEN